ncbi:MAG: hypothetical protein P0S95_07885 [Rhabdochlamydiaceae bacterium]|nr:hypothetical protein [Candidatus Amphrikana amoebophyrae]
MSSDSSKKKLEKILMITVTAGGGHIHATKAKYKQIKEIAPHTRFIFFDVLIDTFGQKIGKACNSLWNSAQEKGDVQSQEWQRRFGHPISEVLFWIPIFCKMVFLLSTNRFDRIIDTQVVGTKAIIKALRVVEFFTRRKIILEKVITELPSDQVLHFTRPIKQLSTIEKKLIQVCCSYSELIEEDKQEGFWQHMCGISAQDVKRDTPPLRLNFLKLIDKERGEEIQTLKIFTHSAKELELIQSASSRGFVKLKNEDPYLSLDIEPTDRVTTIMLGSRPHEKATLEYVQKFIELSQDHIEENRRDIVFVFCRNYDEKPNSLLKRMEELVKFEHNFPANLTILPMPFQDDEVIAPLFWRSDITITRSGGITAMELLAVGHGQIYLHTETISSYKKQGRIGMPAWEEGNARFLIQKKQAQFITPSTFTTQCKAGFTLEERVVDFQEEELNYKQFPEESV